MERLIHWTVRRYLGGSKQAWLFPSLAVFGYRFARKQFGRKEIVDLGKVEKGKTIVIEHLDETHKQQLAAERVERREVKKAKRAQRRARRSAARAARRERRTARRTVRRERRQATAT